MLVQRSETDQNVYAFGPFRLVPDRRAVLRSGEPVRLGARAFDILTVLLQRRGETVSKSDLLAFGWSGAFVDDGNLKVHILALRRALGDGDGATYIATVPGRGYRFVAQVSITRETAEPNGPDEALFRKLPPLRRLVGRQTDIACLSMALAEERCVTIVGGGGVGKTTLAIAIAHHLLPSVAGRVCFVDLSTVGDVRYTLAAIAAAVAATQASDNPLAEIIERLRGRPVLMLLDNCEHLSSAITPVIERLVGELPELKILATSREPLRASREHIHRLSPLEVPMTAKAISAADAMRYGAVQLFVARVQDRGKFALGDDEAPFVAAICRRLDGIPLAIELVADKIVIFGAAGLFSMVEEKLLHLTNSDRAAPFRQHTLSAMLDWSYRLLSDDEAALLRLLSAFAGQFGIEDVVSIAQALGFTPNQAIEAVERLAERSLVDAEYREGVLCYRLLSSTRAYAAEHLIDAMEHDAARDRHAQHMLSLLEKASGQWIWRDKVEWMSDYAERIDDVRQALNWAFDGPRQAMTGARLAAAAIPLFEELSAVGEMCTWVDRALTAIRETGDRSPELRMRLIAAQASGGSFADRLGADVEAAWRDYHRLGLELEDPEHQLNSLWGLSVHLLYAGRPQEAANCICRFLDLATSQADAQAHAEGERMLAMAEIYLGKIPTARQRLEQLAEQYRVPSRNIRVARFQAEPFVAINCSFAFSLWLTGEVGRARATARAAVARGEASGHAISYTTALATCAMPIALWTGDLPGARQCLSALESRISQENIGIWHPVCRFYDSALVAHHGGVDAALRMMDTLDDLMAANHLLRAPMHHGMVADALRNAGLADLARRVVTNARALAESQSAHWCMPELLRIDALIALDAGKARTSEAKLTKAIDLARGAGARAFELRAALSLSGHLANTGRHGEARTLLETTSSGFETDEANADLVEAYTRLQHYREELGFSQAEA